ncbi:MAG: hypothetical protein HYY17_04885 [Planctomycetes bacterium]|nr:hypothetical protein [Planctomycetota bacterium]
MKAVGIKVLKDNLSKYLRLVREGETIWVTDRDEVIAEIHRPTQPVPDKVSPWAAFLNDEARRGSIVPASNRASPPLAELARLPRPAVAIDLQALLAEIKGV